MKKKFLKMKILRKQFYIVAETLSVNKKQERKIHPFNFGCVNFKILSPKQMLQRLLALAQLQADNIYKKVYNDIKNSIKVQNGYLNLIDYYIILQIK